MIRKLIVLLLIALALLVLGILIWWVGPLIKIGELTPLGSELVRAVLIGLIVLVVVGRAIWRRLRTRKASKQLNDSLMQAPAARPAAAAENAEQKVLDTRFTEAVATLKQMRLSAAGKKPLSRASGEGLR